MSTLLLSDKHFNAIYSIIWKYRGDWRMPKQLKDASAKDLEDIICNLALGNHRAYEEDYKIFEHFTPPKLHLIPCYYSPYASIKLCKSLLYNSLRQDDNLQLPSFKLLKDFTEALIAKVIEDSDDYKLSEWTI